MRPVLVTAFLTLLVFSAVTYTACKRNLCVDVNCMHRGACFDGVCACPTGYEGLRCEVLMRDKFITTFNGHDSCGNFKDNVYQQYPIYFTAMRDDSVELTMKNILNDPHDSAVATLLTTDSFYFQGVNNATRYFGTGKLRNDSLWLNFHVQHDTSDYDCHYFGIGNAH